MIASSGSKVGMVEDINAVMADAVVERLDEVLLRLIRVEATIQSIASQQPAKEWYTTDEVARILDRAPFTVREWCRHGRVRASKRDCGRGSAKEWIIDQQELRRIQNEGLLPEPLPYKHVR